MYCHEAENELQTKTTKQNMKKLLALIATIALFAIILSSCKSHELCPAYGKTSAKVTTEKQV
jgi:hypothetical protein